MLVDTVSDAHVHFHYSARRFRDVLLANILSSRNKNEVVVPAYLYAQNCTYVGTFRIIEGDGGPTIDVE